MRTFTPAPEAPQQYAPPVEPPRKLVAPPADLPGAHFGCVTPNLVMLAPASGRNSAGLGMELERRNSRPAEPGTLSRRPSGVAPDTRTTRRAAKGWVVVSDGAIVGAGPLTAASPELERLFVYRCLRMIQCAGRSRTDTRAKPTWPRLAVRRRAQWSAGQSIRELGVARLPTRAMNTRRATHDSAPTIDEHADRRTAPWRAETACHRGPSRLA